LVCGTFVRQVLYRSDTLETSDEILAVNGGSISIERPCGMTGVRQVGHVMYGGKRRTAQYAGATICVGGGQGAPRLFEIIRADHWQSNASIWVSHVLLIWWLNVRST